MIERCELFCTECRRYVQFDLEIEADGNYTIECPNCKHHHYRVVENRQVTEQRWRSSSAPSWMITGASTTYISTYQSYSSVTTDTTATAGTFLYSSWLIRGTGS